MGRRDGREKLGFWVTPVLGMDLEVNGTASAVCDFTTLQYSYQRSICF